MIKQLVERCPGCSPGIQHVIDHNQISPFDVKGQDRWLDVGGQSPRTVIIAMKCARKIPQGGAQAEVRMQSLSQPSAPRVHPHKNGRPTLISENRSQLIEKVDVRSVCIDRTQRIVRVPRRRIHHDSAGVG
jgi:hypothetical protein